MPTASTSTNALVPSQKRHHHQHKHPQHLQHQNQRHAPFLQALTHQQDARVRRMILAMPTGDARLPIPLPIPIQSPGSILATIVDGGEGAIGDAPTTAPATTVLAPIAAGVDVALDRITATTATTKLPTMEPALIPVLQSSYAHLKNIRIQWQPVYHHHHHLYQHMGGRPS